MSKNSIIDSLNKVYGKNAVQKVKLLDKEPVQRDSSGSLFIDDVTGGGWPQGGIVEIIGPESSGKTTLALMTLAKKQELGGIVSFVNSDNTFSESYARKIGVSDDLIICHPENGEQAFEIVYNLINSGGMDIVVVDSVATLIPKNEKKVGIGKGNFRVHSRIMSEACPKISISAKKNNCTVIFINQLREKIGVMFGNPETTPGGNALKFYASIRLDIRASGQILNSDGEKTGNNVRVKCIKNKVSTPFKKCETRFTYGIGFDYVWEILTLAIEKGIVKKSGAWYSIGDTRLGQGENNVLDLLRGDIDTFETIEKLVKDGKNNS